MARYRMRPIGVDAMRFEGTPASVAEVTTWAAAIDPDLVVRQRVEYRGWQDREGHLELEVRGQEHHLMAGDWLVLVGTGREPVLVLSDAEFRDRFEAVQLVAVRDG